LSKQAKNKVALTWDIEKKNDVNDFFIERSEDGFSFDRIGTAEMLLDHNNILSYKWVDKNPLPTIAYYRLVSMSSNKDFSYSNIIATYCESVNEITISPNPFRDIFTIQLPFEASYPNTIEVLDYTGKKVYSLVIKDQTQFVEILLGNKYPSGTYFVKIFNSSAHSVHRVVKIK